MSYTLDLLPDEPILFEVMGSDFQYGVEGISTADHVLSILNHLDYPIFFIVDMSQASLSIDDLAAAASMATRQKLLFHHPNIRETPIVTQSRLMDAAARGLTSSIFGHVKVRVFKTQEDALDYAREAALH